MALVDSVAIARLKDFGGDRLVRGMVDLFVKNAPVRVAEARSALDRGDAAALTSALHALKSSAGQLGLVTIHQACVAGEELAARGELRPCALHVELIERDLPAACLQLGALKPQNV